MIKSFSKTTKLTLFITSSLVFTTLVIGSIVTYNKYVYWKNQYELSIDNFASSNQQLLQTVLKLSNTEIENAFLIDDFEVLDSMLTEEFIKTDKLLTQINQYKDAISTLKQKNSELYQNIGEYKLQIDQLEATVLEKEKELENYVYLLEKKLTSSNVSMNKNMQLNSVADIHQYKLFKFSSKTSLISKGVYKDTKKAKRTEIISLCVDILGAFEFDFGDRNLYLRISDAKGNILPFENHAEVYFNYSGGDILYSQNKQIHFTKKLFPLCIDYKVVDNLSIGIYWIDVFCDGIKIGETSFELL